MSVFQIRFGGMVFDGSERVSSPWWVKPDGIEGWFESPATRSASKSRALADGDFDVPVFRESRFIRWSGDLITDSRFIQTSERHRVGGLPAREAGRFTVQDGSDVEWVNARVDGQPDFEELVYGKIVRYQIGVKANDPRIFGETERFPGASVNVFHRGNTVASPIVKVNGSKPAGYTIAGPGGRAFVVSAPLAAGSQDEIDMHTGLVRRNGSILLSGVDRPQTWGVPPGAETTPFSISTGTLEVLVTKTRM